MYPPRDYPEANSSQNDEAGALTLCSVKERAHAQQPVSDAMIHTAVTNLFSADSHETFTSRSTADATPQRTLRAWLKKPSS